MEASDPPARAPEKTLAPGGPGGDGAEAAGPVTYARSRTLVWPALLGILIGLLAAALCAAVGLLLASAIFGTTGGIL